MSLNPPHDFDSPLSYLNAVEAAALAADLPACSHCHVRHEVVEMSGDGWGLETIHEPGCPEGELG
jgi:hypothetical protein